MSALSQVDFWIFHIWGLDIHLLLLKLAWEWPPYHCWPLSLKTLGPTAFGNSGSYKKWLWTFSPRVLFWNSWPTLWRPGSASEGPRGHSHYIYVVYWPILFKLCMQVACFPQWMICYMAFTINSQAKAAAVSNVTLMFTDMILSKPCAGSLLAAVDDSLHDLYNQRPNKGRSGL